MEIITHNVFRNIDQQFKDKTLCVILADNEDWVNLLKVVDAVFDFFEETISFTPVVSNSVVKEVYIQAPHVDNQERFNRISSFVDGYLFGLSK